MSHFREECKHGKVGGQCRCPSSDKVVRIVNCTFVDCDQHEPLPDDEITRIAYEQIFIGAESFLEDWLDEDGEYSEEDFDKIFNKAFGLLKQLKEKYVYGS